MTTPTTPPEKPPMRYTTHRAECHICERVTQTGILPMSSGHMGRVCCECRTLRRGRPYALRYEYAEASPIPTPATGAEGTYDHTNR